MTVPSSQNAPAQTAGASAGPGDRAARPAVVGHRGAALVSPENTLASFRRALDDGAQLLECDVHLSADGELVVMHDQTIDRTAEASSPLRSGAIAELTRAELDRVILPEGQHIPSLTELLEMSRAPLFVEVKAEAAAEEVARVLTALPDTAPAAASTVISFHPEALSTIHRDAPQIPVSYLVHRLDQGALDTATELGATGIGPGIQGLSLAAAEAGADEIDCGLLGANMVLSAWSMGVGSCCLGSPVRFMKTDKDAAPYLAKLGFSQGYELLYCIAFGYPAETPAAKPRNAEKVKFVD